MLRRFVTAAVVVAAYLGLSPGVAYAAPSCNFSSGSVVITMTAGTSTLTRDAGAGGAIRLDGTQCGTATVANASIASVTGSGGTLRLDLSNGGFAPGLTVETDGISELGFSWNATGTALEILGDPAAADDIRHATNGGIHLNGDNDFDIAFNQQPLSLLVDGRGGNDSIDMSRPNGNGNPAWDATLTGGSGNDVLRGDTATDTVSGDDGDDELADGLGDDGTVSGGNNDDTLYALKTQHDVTFFPGVAIPDAGSTTNALNVNNMAFASEFEVRVTIVHPAMSTLTISLDRVGSPVVLAAGRSGTGYYGTVFDDDATSSITSGSGTYTGRFTPSGGTLASLASGSVSGEWDLTVTDGTADGQSGTLVSWEIATVGGFASVDNGNDAYDGGSGADTLSYASRFSNVTFTAATPTSGTSGGSGESDTYTGVETLVGGAGSDTFHGSSGNDTFVGGEGNDTFAAGLGDDTLDCGPADDTLDYSAAASGVDVDLVAQQATGEGTDTLTACDSVIGSTSADTIKGNDDANTVDPREGDDAVETFGGDDTVLASAGTDLVDAGADDDVVGGNAGDGLGSTYAGGPGTDTISMDPGAVPMSITLDDIANDGTAGETDDVGSDFEIVNGGSGDDTLVGDDDSNQLFGRLGNDTIDGAGGDDYLEGDDGTDTLSFASAPAGVTVDFGLNTASGDGGDVVVTFEDIRGSAFGDTLTTDSGPNTVRPGNGNDVVSTGDGADVLVAEPAPDGADTWEPGDGSDTADFSLRTSAVSVSLDDAANDGAAGEGDNVPNGVEIVRGGLGGDSVVGGIEGNTFYGGFGNDTLLGRGGQDTLYGEGGDDVVLGSSGNDVVDGGIGNDTVNGGEGDDRLLGGANDDTLIGGLGDDDEFGEAGNDRFLQGDTSRANGSDLLVGGIGTDTASYNGRAAAVTVDVDGQFDDGQAYEQDNVSRDVEVVEGTAYNDKLAGNELANTLRGLGGNDTFVEGATASGADTYEGGTGIDTVDYRARAIGVRIDLDNVADDGATNEHDNIRSDVENGHGGAANDVLVGNASANILVGNGGNDTITGGTGVDRLDGGIGNDTLYGLDGVKDALAGGTGIDRAHRDAVDAVSGIESYF